MFVGNARLLAVTVFLLSKLFRPSGKQSTTLVSPPPTDGLKEEISVLSWNILAPCYVLPHLLRSQKIVDDFDLVTEYMDWSYRSPRIVERISQEAADIVCLQEVQLDLWESLRDELKMNGYRVSVVQEVNRGLQVTTVILLHDRRLQEWKVTKVESRSRVLLVTLECRQLPNSEPYFIFIANVHLSAGRKESVTRYQQVKSLLQRLVLHTQRSSVPQLKDPLVILMGDWNTLSTDPLHHLITKGMLPEDHGLPQLYPSLPLLPLRDVHRQRHTHNSKGIVPWTHTCGEVLDYIFASPSIQTVDLRPRSIETTLPIPNADFPSDHIPIGGTLTISKDRT